jgi:hypothetical protein
MVLERGKEFRFIGVKGCSKTGEEGLSERVLE